MSLKESKADATLEYKVEPSVVAAICAEVLSTVGSVKTVSKEEGTVSGKVKTGPFGSAHIDLKVVRKGDKTELYIQTSHGSLLSSGGAEKALAVFREALGFSRLAGKATGSW